MCHNFPVGHVNKKVSQRLATPKSARTPKLHLCSPHGLAVAAVLHYQWDISGSKHETASPLVALAPILFSISKSFYVLHLSP